MAASTLHDEIRMISKGLYRIVSDIVGPECIVKLRRQGLDIQDDLINCNIYSDETMVMSGSRAEGFAFQSSDFDQMFIHRKAVVLTSSTPIIVPYNKMPTILLMETENVTPGFSLIRSIRYDKNNERLKRALVFRGDNVYVSSKQIRESFMSVSNTECHGPCQTDNFLGFDRDRAFTLKCPIWPKQAITFITRSFHHGWPSYDTVTDICKDGCLFVPISNKHQQYSDMDDLQWRISFSLAEKKLICSMNHCQFLCYGLSKLFLNEVLKKLSSDEDLLCSYFMKTAVFWEIFDNPTEWLPDNFLSKFWNVFRRLIKWVTIGYCPNFFIPENNMFQSKIFGQKQRTLLRTLRDLYIDGYWSLLRCPSLNENLSYIITQPEIDFALSINEVEYVPLSMIEREKLNVILRFDIYIDVTKIKEIMKILINMLLTINTDSTEITCAVRLGVHHVLQAISQNLFLSLQSSYSTNSLNRMKYNDYRAAKSILYRAKTFFCMKHFILMKQMYMGGNYHRTKEMIHYIRHKLLSQLYMYEWTLDSDIIMTASQQEMSYDVVVKTMIVSYVWMDKYTAVEELIPESLAKAETIGGSGLLYIPPLVFLNFILILSYTRLGQNHRRYDILDELHTLLYHDDGYHIRTVDKAISWEILGICQQLCGDLHGAYVSYLHALDEEYNYFKQATLERMNSLRKLLKSYSTIFIGDFTLITR